MFKMLKATVKEKVSRKSVRFEVILESWSPQFIELQILIDGLGVLSRF